MTDNTAIRYNEWDEPKPEPLKQFDEVVDLTRWPAGAESDERLYRVAWCRNERALTTTPQEFGHEVGVLLLDAAGEIQWEAVDSRFDEPSQSSIDALAERTGSYFQMSKFANAINKRQDDNFGKRSFTFYPTPVEEVDAR